MPLSQLPAILGSTERPGGTTADTEGLDPFATDRLATYKRWAFAARDASSDWRKEAEDDYGFPAGHQWADDDLQVLRDLNRPTITFNRVGRVLDSVAGLEVGNRQELRFIPRELGDVGVNELATATADWIRDECDAEDEESEGFLDMVTCGLGWFEAARMDYDEKPEGQVIASERIDPLEMFWDPAARKRNLTDSRYRIRVRDIALDDAKAMFPDHDDEELHAAWFDWTRAGGDVQDREASRDYRGQFGDGMPSPKEDRQVRILQIQYYEKEAYHLVADPTTGQTVEMEPERFEKLSATMGKVGAELQGVKLRRKVYRQAFVGSVVLEDEDAPCNQFTLLAMTGKRDRNKNTWYGLVRAMKDPQRWANKWLSQILHIINTNAKGGLLAEKTAVENPAEFENSWADPAAISWVMEGAISKGQIKEKSGPQMPASIFQLMQFAIQSITDTPGINLELLGLADREQAGILEHQRKQAGMTILAGLFDSLRRYRKESGRVLLAFIRDYVPEGTLVRLSSQGQYKYIPLLKDQLTAEFDVIVDTAPASPNNKELVWGMMQPFIPMLLKLPGALPVMAEIVRYSPFPESVSEKIIAAMQPKPQEGPSPEEMQAQAEAQANQQKLQLEDAKTQAGIQAQQAGLQLDAAKLADQKEARAADLAEKERGREHEKELKAIELLLKRIEMGQQAYTQAQDRQQKQGEAAAGRSERQQDRVQQFVMDSKTGGLKDVAETQKASEKVLADVGAVAERVIGRLDEQLQTIEATTERIEARDAQILAELRDRPRRIELQRDGAGMVAGWRGDNGSGGQVLRGPGGMIEGATVGG